MATRRIQFPPHPAPLQQRLRLSCMRAINDKHVILSFYHGYRILAFVFQPSSR